MVGRFISARVSGESAIDRSDTRIDRQRRRVGLVLFVIFIGLPATFLLIWDYFPDFALRLFR